jgi:hypothetical protein
MPDLTYTNVTYRGMTFGRGTVWKLNRGNGLVGWEELSAADVEKRPRFGGHGNAPGTVRFDGRTVIMSGYVEAAQDRDALVAQFRQAMVPGVDPTATDTLTVSVAGATLYADVQLVAAAIDLGGMWGSGWFPFKAQWWAPDHRRFAGWQSVDVGFQGATGGITPPLTPPLTFPAAPPSGAALVNNTGPMPAPVVITLIGPISNYPGVQVGTTGKLMRFPVTLAAGQTLVIDSGGYATMDGSFISPTSSSALTSELEAPTGATTYQALGDPQAGSPRMVVAFRPAYG